jgi:very-short-patch-repair endonuclease
MRKRLNNLIKQIARKLRRRQTQSEKILWQELRDRQVCGMKFLRQHPMPFNWRGQKRFFVTDFCCCEAKLIVELDGKIHDYQKDYDKTRDFILAGLGYKVIRIKNEEIKYNLKNVITRISSFSLLNKSPSLIKRRATHPKDEWGELTCLR